MARRSVNVAHARRFGLRPDTLLAFDRSNPVIDSLAAAILFGAILFVGGLGPLTPLIVAAVTPLYCLFRWERVPTALLRCWPLLLLPGFCLLSAVWSDAPSASLRYGLLYLVTILPALLLGAGSDRLALLKGIFAVFAVYSVASLIFGRHVPWGNTGLAFVGLGGSKNLAGDVAALTILITLATGFWALGERKIVWLALVAATLPIALYELWQSRASGALFAVMLASACLILWTMSRRFSLSTRSTFFALSLLVALLLAITANQWAPALFERLLETSGKDQGLTGRDFLWQKADELIAARPLLGGGYRHFWLENNLDAQTIWQRMEIATHYGFNFHNTPRDIAVDLGVIGLALFTVVTAYGLARSLLSAMIRPYFIAIFLCALIVFEAPRLFFELVAYHDMHYSTVLVFLIMAYGMRPSEMPEMQSAALEEQRYVRI